MPPSHSFCGVCGTSQLEAGDRPTRTSVPGAGPGASAVTGPQDEQRTEARFVPGTVVGGRYRIVALLGRGGMGDVCRADDLKLGQPVALKFLPLGLERSEDRLRRLLNEVKLARQIAHPNVCRVYDVGEVDGQHFISMEYVDGEDLTSLLRRIGRLPEDKAVQIARQLCAGLSAAHDRGILHRDLKPANVMIDGRGQVRITDFGLAALEDEIRGAELQAGTPEYMAPEQIERRTISTRSDIYSLGHVLYELFTGRATFRADTWAEVSRMQREDPPTSPASFVPTLDPAVERVILRCLEKDPELRPASALAVAASLPGADPLAAALAAGETPSPEMVAAAGPDGGLRPAVALACFGAVLAGLVLAVVLAREATLYGRVSMNRSVPVLADRAVEILRNLGYDEPPRDRWAALQVNRPALDYLARTERNATRWDALAEPGQGALYLSYRQRPELLVPSNVGGQVTSDDPPPGPGDIALGLDLEGQLTYLRVVPAAADPGESSTEPADWPALFSAAGLDIEAFEPAAPTLQPQAYVDTRVAWTGTLARRGGVPVRVEAGSLRGRPIYFDLVTPDKPEWSSDVPSSEPATALAGATANQALVIAILAGALFLAQRNWRLGRGDRRGALRIGLFGLLLSMLGWVCAGHHVARLVSEFTLFERALGVSLWIAALCWTLYVALEPYFRRLWPEALVSWTRLLSGRWRDPLVGRDLLVGCALGVAASLVTTLANLAPAALGLPPRAPLGGSVGALMGGRWAGAQFFDVLLSCLPYPLLHAFLFLGLRLILRRQRLAAIGYGMIMATFLVLEFAPAGDGSVSAGLIAVGLVYAALISLVRLVALLRFGVLALAATFLITILLHTFPLTFDTAAPYFATSLLALALAVGLSFHAFWISLAGRPLFQDSLLEQRPRRAA